MNHIIPIRQFNKTETGVVINRINKKYVNDLQNDLKRSHRDEYYIVILLEKGSIEFFVDFKKITLSKHILFFLYPGQVHHSISFNKCVGWALFFDNKLVDEQCRLVLEESLLETPTVSLKEEDLFWFLHVIEALYYEYTHRQKSYFSIQTITSLSKALIYRSSNIYQLRESLYIYQHSTRSSTIVKDFKRLIHLHYKEIKKPSTYAELMNVSLSHLNSIVKRITGFTVTYFIQQEVIKEAQRLLYHTDMSVKEISFLLGYDDYKYFNRLFSKNCGKSPGKFRKMSR